MAKAKRASRAASLTIDLPRARAHWYARQGLAERLKGEVPEVLAATGWGRTLGGADVYLMLRARMPEVRRAAIDAAVEASRAQVIPAARGCIYLVPRAHVPLALKVAEELARKRLDAELTKAGVKDGEMSALGKQIVKTLKARGPLGTDALRKALPEGAVRSLGEAGKKVGISSTLPPALRLMEFEGALERTLEGGRLDTERYLWRATEKSPFAEVRLPADAEARRVELARVFVGWVGPVSTSDFASWSGLGKRDAAAALEACGLATIAVSEYAEEAWVREEELPLLAKPAEASGVAFLSFEDGYLTPHEGTRVVTAPAYHDREMKSWGMPGKTKLGEALHIQSRALVVDGLIAGFWEYDAAKREVVYAPFEALQGKRKNEAAEAAARLAEFIAEDLGHARSFSLDTDALVAERAAEIRKAR